MLIALALLACTDRGPIEPLDLSEPLGPGEARAGVVTDERALFGGISAEGRVGDVKIYNDRVRFVIQAPRPGDYYVQQGGGVIDADIVRPEGQPGRDMVEEWMGMYGFGRLLDPRTVAVVSTGAVGGPAQVVVEGGEAPLELLTGAVETPGLIANLGLHVRTEYLLAPDAWLLEVRSTITAGEDDVTALIPGDILLSANERTASWDPGVGLETPSEEDRLFSGFTSRYSDGAAAIVAAPGEAVRGIGPLGALAAEAGITGGFGAPIDIPAGESVTFVRYYGVGPDLATITDAAHALHGLATDEVSGEVTAPDGPVAGARVNVLVGGDPYTLAHTDDSGAFSATVPAGAEVSFVAVGRGSGIHVELPEGAVSYGPYAAKGLHEEALRSYEAGAPPVPHADGRGWAEGLSLGEPAWLVVESDGPFAARAVATGADPDVDRRFVPRRTASSAALLFSRTGALRVPVEPGTYDVVVHRGIRFEAHVERVTLAAGAETVVDAPLAAAYAHPGWVLGDPHSHAAPSGDGEISMEDRLVVTAATGVQLHFGTDHDHVVDYNPLLAPLGLEGTLTSVVADEASPVTRGHMNVYPLVPDPSRPNGGALPWWSGMPPTTEEWVTALRENHGDVVVQMNHPLGKGTAQAADWSPGRIGDPDRWTTDFEAMEVDNSSNLDAVLLYLDLVTRGYRIAPVGVTDSHGHTGGKPGLNGTFFSMDGYSAEALLGAVRRGETIATRGPFLDLDLRPGASVAAGTPLNVRARHPSWMPVDRVQLLRDGVVAEEVAGDTASFVLDPEEDAIYHVVALGGSMAPVYDDTAWAMSGSIYVDVGGDGWSPPLPPITQ